MPTASSRAATRGSLGYAAGSGLAQHPRLELTIFAAGSLREALTEIARIFEQDHPFRVSMTFGASGLLKDRLLAGERPHLFASANMEHPEALADTGIAHTVSAFARNSLCVLASPRFNLKGQSLAARLLDTDVRVGTSTPLADPSGDYAFALFERIEAMGAAGPGSASTLKRKALQLTGAADSLPAPAGRSVYGELVAGGEADAFVTYRTNATRACLEQPSLRVLEFPDAVNVSARYGVALLNPADAPGQAFVHWLLGPEAQAVLASHGFRAP